MFKRYDLSRVDEVMIALCMGVGAYISFEPVPLNLSWGF